MGYNALSLGRWSTATADYSGLDIVLSPWNGRVWATATDTCVGECVTGNGPADAAAGAVLKQVDGPLLWTTDHFKSLGQ